MRKFNVTGMSCAACSSRIEKAVGNLSGVESCSVSLLTNSMGVEGSASDEQIMMPGILILTQMLQSKKTSALNKNQRLL